MPVDIRELIITARVEDKSSGSKSNGSSPVKTQGMNERELQRIVSLCAEQVMDIIKRQTER
jgi:hypothetical protein